MQNFHKSYLFYGVILSNFPVFDKRFYNLFQSFFFFPQKRKNFSFFRLSLYFIIEKTTLGDLFMLLSELTNKPIYVKNTKKGVCLGIGVSLKTYTVKYLVCTGEQPYRKQTPRADFFLSLSAVESVDADAVRLSSLRAVCPKNCALIFIGMPIYSENGLFLGNLDDLRMQDFTLDKLYFNQSDSVSCTCITASFDALILRKERPYPIGQRIHTPTVKEYFHHSSPIVTKATLKSALEKSALIKLTLSLSPFRQEWKTDD
jgi:hypothetical protein